MEKSILSKLAKIHAKKGNTDHPDMDQVDALSKKHGADLFTGRKAFFAGRDLRTLQESELLDGGNGSEARRVDLEALAEETFNP